MRVFSAWASPLLVYQIKKIKLFIKILILIFSFIHHDIEHPEPHIHPEKPAIVKSREEGRVDGEI